MGAEVEFGVDRTGADGAWGGILDEGFEDVIGVWTGNGGGGIWERDVVDFEGMVGCVEL